jgi:hypothetical protein
MNEPNSTPERRYGVSRVILRSADGDMLLRGEQFCWSPVDEPPLIEVPSIGRCWYRQVWIDRGWSIHDDEEVTS